MPYRWFGQIPDAGCWFFAQAIWRLTVAMLFCDDWCSKMMTDALNDQGVESREGWGLNFCWFFYGFIFIYNTYTMSFNVLRWFLIAVELNANVTSVTTFDSKLYFEMCCPLLDRVRHFFKKWHFAYIITTNHVKIQWLFWESILFRYVCSKWYKKWWQMLHWLVWLCSKPSVSTHWTTKKEKM